MRVRRRWTSGIGTEGETGKINRRPGKEKNSGQEKVNFFRLHLRKEEMKMRLKKSEENSEREREIMEPAKRQEEV